MPKILIADELSPRALDIFRSRGLEVDVRIGLKESDLVNIIAGYDGLAVRSATKVEQGRHCRCQEAQGDRPRRYRCRQY